MDKKLLEIDELVKKHIGPHKMGDEKLFELGVELGRYLAESKISNYRLPFFVEQEVSKSQSEQKRELIDKAESLLLKILLNAYKAQLAEGNGIVIETNRFGVGTSSFTEDITKKFGIIHTRTDQDSIGGDFELSFHLQGDLNKIFRRHNIPPTFTVSVSNNNGEDSDSIYDEKSLEDQFYSLRLDMHYQNISQTVEQLEEFLKDFEKNILFLLIKRG
jgi:hypothetical protein